MLSKILHFMVRIFIQTLASSVFASSQLGVLKKGWSRASFAVRRSDGLYFSKPYNRSANPDLVLSTCFDTISCKNCEKVSTSDYGISNKTCIIRHKEESIALNLETIKSFYSPNTLSRVGTFRPIQPIPSPEIFLSTPAAKT